MSTSYSEFVEVRHFNDCRQQGCPGHKLRIVYHNTSDTLTIEIDGEGVWTMDPNIFEAAIQAHEAAQNKPTPGETRRGLFGWCIAIAVWLFFGYVGAALYAGQFYGKFGDGIETKGSASREATLFVGAGPIYAFCMWTECNYPPMWDWPRHLFEYPERKP